MKIDNTTFKGDDPGGIIVLLRRLGWRWEIEERPTDIIISLYPSEERSQHWATDGTIADAFARLRRMTAESISPALGTVARKADDHLKARAALEAVEEEVPPEGDPYMGYHNKRANAMNRERGTREDLQIAVARLT